MSLMTLLELGWFGVIVLLAFLMLKGSVSALFALIAFLGAIGIHYLTNKGDPFIVNLAPLGAGFRMFVAEFVMILSLLTGNIPLFLLSAAYIPFEYYVGD
ncbi:MAG: hypothetical protein H0Z18_10880 [Thermococcus sp.]|uniref:hypothetical protein n=1 Tax=Thermococcus sp. TaxID=35749 RepID=UPI001DFF7BB2|nr:hypothetical protein [Thermococcus sp.]MBO8175750.1 hypothetical protein [Thermococcus sp.]